MRKDLTDCTPRKKNAKTELLSLSEVIFKVLPESKLKWPIFLLQNL